MKIETYIIKYETKNVSAVSATIWSPLGVVLLLAAVLGAVVDAAPAVVDDGPAVVDVGPAVVDVAPVVVDAAPAVVVVVDAVGTHP